MTWVDLFKLWFTFLYAAFIHLLDLFIYTRFFNFFDTESKLMKSNDL